jgi:alpha-L-arabinofuranosidase
LQYARGSTLDVLVDAPSSYEVSGIGAVPHLDVAATLDRASGSISVLVLNRDLKNPRPLELTWEAGSPGKLQSAWALTGDDLKAVNGFDSPERVKPLAAAKPATSGGSTKPSSLVFCFSVDDALGSTEKDLGYARSRELARLHGGCVNRIALSQK